jgi:hypothetical protein
VRLADGGPDPLDEAAGELAFVDFLAKLRGIIGFEDVIQVGEHRAESQSHGRVQGSGFRVQGSKKQAAI